MVKVVKVKPDFHFLKRRTSVHRYKHVSKNLGHGGQGGQGEIALSFSEDVCRYMATSHASNNTTLLHIFTLLVLSRTFAYFRGFESTVKVVKVVTVISHFHFSKMVIGTCNHTCK